VTADGTTPPPTTASLIPRDQLEHYLATLPHLAAELPLERIERIGHGQSNITFRLHLRHSTLVLRRPPLGPLPPRAHDVLREYRVMHALHRSASAVPVPRMRALCEDASVLGAPFFLMEALDGDAIRFDLPPSLAAGTPLLWRMSVGEQLIDALAALHTTSPEAVGLADLGRPSGYLVRQLHRWQGQLEYARVRPVDDLDWLATWLTDNLPASDARGGRIVHGDYKLDNAIFSNERPPRLLGVVDWEMATLGDPLADLGWLLAFWREPDDPPRELKILPAVMEQPGFSSRAALAERYAARTAQPLPEYLPFYVVFALWKMAVVLEGHWARHVRGTATDFDFAYLQFAGPLFWKRIRQTAEKAFE
jgi:aminoglycoside phosphotransferase (APT) family kinase protein